MKEVNLLLRVVSITALVLVLTSVPILATSPVVVTVGNYVKYGQLSANYTGPSPTPNSINEVRNTTWMMESVQNVTGDEVTLQQTKHYNNGTQQVETLKGNITSSAGNITFFLIPASLKKNDTFPLTPPPVFRINDTLTRTYAGATRSTNLLNFTTHLFGNTVRFTYYFDKATGFALEFILNSTGGGQSTQFSAKTTQTNLWSAVATFPVGMLFLGILLMTAATYPFMRRR